jgi:ABC-2 type transport system ATP-binding protein
VLLSSHVLSEVQRVADRVGVLREGQLIAVDRLDHLRERSLHHIRATFAEDVDPVAFGALPGVRDLQVHDQRALSCSAPESGLDALLKEVSRHTVLDFECAEAELEETFLAYYEGEEPTPVREDVHAP